MNPLALATVLGLLCTAQTAPTTQPGSEPTLDQLRQEQMAMARAGVERYREAEPAKLDDLLEHEFENGYLILSLGTPVAPGGWRQPLEDRPEAVAGLLIRGEGELQSVTVGISQIGERPEDLMVRTEAIYGAPFGSLQLAQDRAFVKKDGTEGIWQTSVVQLSLAGTPEDAGVRLRVSGDDRETGEWVSLVFETDTFETLMRDEPVAFLRHVTPMLETLGLGEIAHAQTRAAARQLLLDQMTVPPEVQERVQALIVELDSDEARVRDRAEQALRDLGLPAASSVRRLLEDSEARGKLSAEQILRLRNVLAEVQALGPEALEALRSDPGFWRRVEQLEGEEGDEFLVEMAAKRSATDQSR